MSERSLEIEYGAFDSFEHHDLLLRAAYVQDLGGPSAVAEVWKEFLYADRNSSEAIFAFESIIHQGEFESSVEEELAINRFIDRFSFGYAILMAPELNRKPQYTVNSEAAFEDIVNICQRIDLMFVDRKTQSQRPDQILKVYGLNATKRFTNFNTIIEEYDQLINQFQEPSEREIKLGHAGFGMAAHFWLKLSEISTKGAFDELMEQNDNWSAGIRVEWAKKFDVEK